MNAPKEPVLPDLTLSSDREKVARIQNYIEEFQYNYSGKPFLKLKKNGGADHIKLSAQKLIQISLPIQCVEAVFLGCYLTAGIESVDRIPVSFKSIFRGATHRHIVLAVRHEDKWGAIGLSRRENLMNKDFAFDTLCDLLREYETSYGICFHRLVTVYIGLPLPRSFQSMIPIVWKAIKIKIYKGDNAIIARDVELFCARMDHDKREHYGRDNFLPHFNTIR